MRDIAKDALLSRAMSEITAFCILQHLHTWAGGGLHDWIPPSMNPPHALNPSSPVRATNVPDCNTASNNAPDN